MALGLSEKGKSAESGFAVSNELSGGETNNSVRPWLRPGTKPHDQDDLEAKPTVNAGHVV
jgi:hypothetical protein